MNKQNKRTIPISNSTKILTRQLNALLLHTDIEEDLADKFSATNLEAFLEYKKTHDYEVDTSMVFQC